MSFQEYGNVFKMQLVFQKKEIVWSGFLKMTGNKIGFGVIMIYKKLCINKKSLFVSLSANEYFS